MRRTTFARDHKVCRHRREDKGKSACRACRAGVMKAASECRLMTIRALIRPRRGHGGEAGRAGASLAHFLLRPHCVWLSYQTSIVSRALFFVRLPTDRRLHDQHHDVTV